MAGAGGTDDFFAVEAEGLIGERGEGVFEIIKGGDLQRTKFVNSEIQFGDLTFLNSGVRFNGNIDFAGAIGAVGTEIGFVGRNLIAGSAGW